MEPALARSRHRLTEGPHRRRMRLMIVDDSVVARAVLSRMIESDPGKVLCYRYDIVLNGFEIGGGSIRIHRRDIQERVFAVMGLSAEEAQQKFGFLLDAFSFGAPPHGGIAFGWDRICALLSGTDSIRDVIAFPKAASGADPLTGAPAPVDEAQLRELGLALRRRSPAARARGR